MKVEKTAFIISLLVTVAILFYYATGTYLNFREIKKNDCNCGNKLTA